MKESVTLNILAEDIEASLVMPSTKPIRRPHRPALGVILFDRIPSKEHCCNSGSQHRLDILKVGIQEFTKALHHRYPEYSKNNDNDCGNSADPYQFPFGGLRTEFLIEINCKQRCG